MPGTHTDKMKSIHDKKHIYQQMPDYKLLALYSNCLSAIVLGEMCRLKIKGNIT